MKLLWMSEAEKPVSATETPVVPIAPELGDGVAAAAVIVKFVVAVAVPSETETFSDPTGAPGTVKVTEPEPALLVEPPVTVAATPFTVT